MKEKSKETPIGANEGKKSERESNESSKKQIPLRLSKHLYDSIARWSEDEFRSINGQIEYLLTEAVRQRNKGSASKSDAEE